MLMFTFIRAVGSIEGDGSIAQGTMRTLPKSSRIMGFIYAAICAALCWVSYDHSHQTFEVEMLDRFCGKSVTQMLHNDGKELIAYSSIVIGKTDAPEESTALKYLTAAQEGICDDQRDFVDLARAILFWSFIALCVATATLFYMIFDSEAKEAIFLALLLMFGTLLALIQLSVFLALGEALKFNDRIAAPSSETKAKTEMLSGLIFISTLLNLLGFVTLIVSFASAGGDPSRANSLENAKKFDGQTNMSAKIDRYVNVQ